MQSGHEARCKTSVLSSQFPVKKPFTTETQRRQRKISPVVWKVFTENRELSHNFLPQTTLLLTDRVRAGRGRHSLGFEERCPTHRGTRLLSPTNRRMSATVLLSTALPPVLLSSSFSQHEQVDCSP